ncbi:NAD(P)-dependent oxidoreductase [Phenylobacterium montanum]|uniref:precorrin-2 dehydrogenase n=1 Tax=Phenylobacterium montanum TaxID=2823693 RepID=A0A975FW61_9CAUL|nr:NAD(P)-dependent oxidoreductase [Caulobacter sp. S6]QUD86256.1 siroheme synthase [Caulobacter sp. S6]
MDAFPAFFPLAGRLVVIAGDGEAAEAKARLFETSPAQVVRLTQAAAITPEAFRGACLAFVASADETFRNAAAAAARTAGVPVNVVDHPALCDFTTPAVIDRGEVVAAVGTGGAAPMLATLLRQDIEAKVPEGAGRVAALLGASQERVRKALPELPRRRAFLRATLTGPAAEAAMAGDMARAHRLLDEALEAASTGGKSPGKVAFLAAAGPAERLSLKAARALGQADALVIHTGCDPHVIELARRDARRLNAAEASREALAALAGEGLFVVSLAPKAPGKRELEALAEAGVAVEVLPVAV